MPPQASPSPNNPCHPTRNCANVQTTTTQRTTFTGASIRGGAVWVGVGRGATDSCACSCASCSWAAAMAACSVACRRCVRRARSGRSRSRARSVRGAAACRAPAKGCARGGVCVCGSASDAERSSCTLHRHDPLSMPASGAFWRTLYRRSRTQPVQLASKRSS